MGLSFVLYLVNKIMGVRKGVFLIEVEVNICFGEIKKIFLKIDLNENFYLYFKKVEWVILYLLLLILFFCISVNGIVRELKLIKE